MTLKSHISAFALLAPMLLAQHATAQDVPAQPLLGPVAIESAKIKANSWEALANKLADKAVASLGAEPKLFVAEGGASPFEKKLLGLVLTRLHDKGVTLLNTATPEAAALTITSTLTLRHTSNVSGIHALADSGRVLLSLPVAVRSDRLSVTSADVELTVSVKEADVILIHQAESFTVEREDLALYRKSGPTLNIVGEQK